MSQSNVMKLERVLDEWSGVLGTGFCLTDSKKLAAAGRSASHEPIEPIAILQPKTVAEVQQVVRIATRHGCPLHPVSGGKNIGYGAACPPGHGMALLDLSRMDRVVEVNSELCYAVIEPGVTQGALSDLLQQQAPTLMMDSTGAPRSASVIGSVLERGHGHTPYGERVLNLIAYDVVLADGRLLSTGFGHYPSAKCRHLYPWGLGPVLHPLFTQSNYGVVVRATVWLLPRPQYSTLYTFSFPNDETAAAAVPVLRQLRLRGIINTPLHLLNDLRFLTMSRRFPFATAKQSTHLDQDELERLRQQHRLAAWSAVGAVHGSRREVRFRIGEIRRALRGYATVRTISLNLVRIFRHSPKLFEMLSGRPHATIEALMRLVRGEPSDTPLQALYWRKRTEGVSETGDPLQDNCGIMWCSPVIPSSEEDFLTLVGITRATCERHLTDANVSLNFTAERAACAIVGLFFDKADPQEFARMKQCQSELYRAYAANGYYPYRAGHRIAAVAPELFHEEDSYWQVCRELKQMFDPQGIISPGRYGITLPSSNLALESEVVAARGSVQFSHRK
ncbi:MAG: FAD-binding oxidoreductase [Bdellovibrionales bacterium]|nr:FAD-binding oxidoreductase [Bdellovibrionales bacterium]